MVESGAWLCFDHVQRLPVETLSKLSQHVKHIHHMYAAVKSAADTQYTVRGHDECGNLKVRRVEYDTFFCLLLGFLIV